MFDFGGAIHVQVGRSMCHLHFAVTDIIMHNGCLFPHRLNHNNIKTFTPVCFLFFFLFFSSVNEQNIIGYYDIIEQYNI